MTRRVFIERTLRQIYNDFPSADSNITENLVNAWLNDAVGVAARQAYSDSIKIDAVAYVNGSFYTTFKALSITKDENFTFKITLPEIPAGLGRHEGISTLKFKDADNNNISLPASPISQAQKGYFESLRKPPNRILFCSEGKYLYVFTPITLTSYTAQVTMVSGGDSTDLDSELNVPPDYMPVVVEYIKQQLLLERAQPQDTANDGQDNK